MTHGKVALVTGGTRGIGFGIATALAQDGYHLVITGRRSSQDAQPALTALRTHLQGADQTALYLQADVAIPQDRQRLLDEIQTSFTRLDLLVNNAGIAPTLRADILDATEASFDELIATNLKGPYFLTQAVARWMLRQAEQAPAQRSIINISSISATVASTNRGDYCITKAGIAMATMLWAARLTGHGIGVYEVRPGIIETDMTKAVKNKYDNLISGDPPPRKALGNARGHRPRRRHAGSRRSALCSRCGADRWMAALP